MLPLFKKKGDNLWNFRCPYCGDSQKSRTKARGYVFRKKNDLFYKCHNCGVGATLPNLIKHVDSKTYDDYILERYREEGEHRSKYSPVPKPEFKFNAPVLRKIYLNHFDPFRNWPIPTRREDWLKREEYRNSFSPMIYTYAIHFINSRIR